ncbi:hypothetical protein DFH94DRAFT_634901 [Russula ochroleuca]|uniref:G-patch domain-containing protein n=1 Tax=Russula ochroleuca TaxID=152965 RepID=A0A9P5MS81_9AGAM|nr:hypothetical protein DFH94DRAFT_634901 [Russula ochroleuca]
MATVTHYIRDDDYADNLQESETGQASNDDGDDAPDPWHTESSSAGFHASRRLIANAPKFVPALLPYDEWGYAAAPASTSTEPTLTPSDPPHGDVASWYRSLNRKGPSSGPTQPPPPPPPSHSTPSSPPPSSSARFSSRRQHRGPHEWFISRAISHSQSASAPPSPRPNTSKTCGSSSLVDILSRYGPSAQPPFRPPVFLHLGPSNKGWAMLQNQGWSEGEGLGAGKTSQEKRKKTRLDSLSPPTPAPMLPTSPSQERATKEEEQEEIFIDDDDDDPIIEVRRKAPVPMIDLTQSDTEDEGESDDDNFYSPASSPAPPTASSPPDTNAAPGDPRAAQTALLTPLPAILKSDRLGIGLKAKTEGPYRSSVKRRVARRNAAAEDMHIRRILLGKGHRAFARAERLERESRQNMMAYLNEP